MVRFLACLVTKQVKNLTKTRAVALYIQRLVRNKSPKLTTSFRPYKVARGPAEAPRMLGVLLVGPFASFTGNGSFSGGPSGNFS